MTTADFVTSSRPDYDEEWDVEPQDSDEREDLAWRADALCAQTDPEAFFPEKGGGTKDAKALCAQCDVREQCLKFSLENDEEHGIWGGLSTKERRKIIDKMGLKSIWSKITPDMRREHLQNAGLLG